MSCQCRGLLILVCSVALICCPLAVEASSHLRARNRELSMQQRLQEDSDEFTVFSAPSPAQAPATPPMPPPFAQAPATPPMRPPPLPPAASPMVVPPLPPVVALAPAPVVAAAPALPPPIVVAVSPAPPPPVVVAAAPSGAPPVTVQVASPLPCAMAPAAPPLAPPVTTAWPTIPVTPLPTNQPLLAGSLCATVSSCSHCTALPECGWCALEMKCVDGTKLGPRTEQCLAYDFMHCSNIACDARTTCTDCLADHGCGWCASKAKCVGGDGSGPFTASTCPAPSGFKGARPVWAHAFAATKCEDTPPLHSSQLWESLRGLMYKSRARMARMDAQAAAAAASVAAVAPPAQPMVTSPPCNAQASPTPQPLNQATMPPMLPMVGFPGSPPSFSMPGFPGVIWSAQTALPPVLPTTLPPETTEKPTTTTMPTTTTFLTTTIPTTTLSTTPCPTPAPTAPTTPLIILATPPPSLHERPPIEVNVDINQHVDTKANARQVHQETNKKTELGSEATKTMAAPAAVVAMSPSMPWLAFHPPAPAPTPVGLPAAFETKTLAADIAGVTLPPVAGVSLPPGVTLPPAAEIPTVKVPEGLPPLEAPVVLSTTADVEAPASDAEAPASDE